MFKNSSCTINGKHTFRDYGLYVTNQTPIQAPEVRTQFVQVPGRNGDIDLTDALVGEPVYANRQITLQLAGKKRPEDWPHFISQFMMEIHGRQVTVVFDSDEDWFYRGRAIVQTDYQRGNDVARFTLSITAEPFKIRAYDTTQPWLWDPFRFPDGVIAYYSGIEVNGTKQIRVVSPGMPVVPEFLLTAPMTVTYNGKTVNLPAGRSKDYDLAIRSGTSYMTFTGYGTVTIEYDVGRL